MLFAYTDSCTNSYGTQHNEENAAYWLALQRLTTKFLRLAKKRAMILGLATRTPRAQVMWSSPKIIIEQYLP